MASSPCIRELDRRISDGIDVRLCWSTRDDEIFVAISDGKTGDEFEIPVRAGDSALEVFRHPYAFAAMPGRRRHSGQSATAQSPGPDATATKRAPSWLRAAALGRRARAL